MREVRVDDSRWNVYVGKERSMVCDANPPWLIGVRDVGLMSIWSIHVCEPCDVLVMIGNVLGKVCHE